MITFGLLAASGAPKRLVSCWFDDPVLGPGECAEVDEVLFPAALVSVCVYVTVASRAEGERRWEFTVALLKNRS